MRFLQRAVAVFSGNLAFALSSFVVASILIRKEDLESYGFFMVLQACFQAWVIISKPVTWQSIVKYSDEYCFYDLLIKSMRIEALAAIATSICITILWLSATAIFDDINTYFFIVITIVFAAIFYNNGTVIGYLRSKREFYLISCIQGWMAISRVILCYFYYYDIELLFLLSLFADAIGWFVAMVYVFVKASKDKDCSNKNNIKLSKFIKFSLWGTLHASLDLPLTQLDKVIISSLVGLEIAGVFNLIRKLSAVMNQIADPIYQVSFPEYSTFVYNKDYDKAKRMSLIISIYMIILGLSAIIVAWFSFDFIDQFLFDNKLTNYLFELLGAIIIQTFALVFIWIHPLFISFGFMKDNAKILLFSNAAFVICLVSLLEEIGIWGALLAILFQYLIVILCKVFYVRNKTSFFVVKK